jgi:hypothetical protein
MFERIRNNAASMKRLHSIISAVQDCGGPNLSENTSICAYGGLFIGHMSGTKIVFEELNVSFIYK